MRKVVFLPLPLVIPTKSPASHSFLGYGAEPHIKMGQDSPLGHPKWDSNSSSMKNFHVLLLFPAIPPPFPRSGAPQGKLSLVPALWDLKGNRDFSRARAEMLQK